GVEDEVVAAIEGIGAVVPRAGPAGAAAQHFGGTAAVHALAVAIEVGAGERARASDHDAVVAFGAAAAVVERDEQVIPAVAPEHERRFDRARFGFGIVDQDRTGALGQRVPLLRLGRAQPVLAQL